MKTLINRCLSLIALLAVLVVLPTQAQVNYDKITYIHSDASGTPIAASDEQGNIVWTIDHYPYGAEHSNDANNRAGTLSFAGKAYDEETGLSYFGGRWYNAHIGRFMGIDPAPVNSEDWRSFNRYSYGFNNPYKYIDPDGWEPVDPHADTDGDGTPNFAEASYVKFDTVLGAGLNVSHGTLSIGLGMANGKVGATKEVGGSIRNVNKVGGTKNCANCAIATDAILAGNPASALNSGLTKVTDVEKFFGSKFGSLTSATRIQGHFQNLGNGARGVVFGSRGGQPGHFFNVVNQNGTVRFLDGQTGKAADLTDGFRGFSFLRTN